jgi:hypothetical protein
LLLNTHKQRTLCYLNWLNESFCFTWSRLATKEIIYTRQFLYGWFPIASFKYSIKPNCTLYKTIPPKSQMLNLLNEFSNSLVKMDSMVHHVKESVEGLGVRFGAYQVWGPQFDSQQCKTKRKSGHHNFQGIFYGGVFWKRVLKNRHKLGIDCMWGKGIPDGEKDMRKTKDGVTKNVKSTQPFQHQLSTS